MESVTGGIAVSLVSLLGARAFPAIGLRSATMVTVLTSKGRNPVMLSGEATFSEFDIGGFEKDYPLGS